MRISENELGGFEVLLEAAESARCGRLAIRLRRRHNFAGGQNIFQIPFA
jgi:hypothetical protein